MTVACISTKMKRIPEPELMDDDVQAQAYANANFEEPHSRFIALLRESLPDLPDHGSALDLGCGPADISIRFARAFPSWTVNGFDGSPAMLRFGREAVVAAGLQSRVSLMKVRLPEMRAPRKKYDLLFSNSLLHHLSEPSVFWRSVRRWTHERSAVFVMDLIRPDSFVHAQQLANRYTKGEPEILSRDFLNSLHAAYRIEEVKGQLKHAHLDGLHIKEVSDRHFMVWGWR